MERLLTLYSEVQSTDVRWLWYPFIAIGKITLLQGDPGDGKSTMMMNLIAELSTGGKTPDGCKIGAPQAIMFTPKPQEYTDPLTGEMKKKQMKFFPDAYKNRIGKSYNDYIADHQMNMFEDFIGYQSSTVLDEPEREAGTTSIPIPQREESENIPLPDLPGQLENVQQSGNEIAKRGMPT